jgi:hypothetical protein
VNALDGHKARIIAAIPNITKDTPHFVWQEVGCKWDVRRDIYGAHCEIFDI